MPKLRSATGSLASATVAMLSLPGAAVLTGCAETNEPPVEVVEPDDVTVLPTTGAAPTPTSTTIVVTLPPTTTTSAQTAPPVTVGVSYANCTEVREAGAAPIRRDEPGYNTDLDRDGDGIACEN